MNRIWFLEGVSDGKTIRRIPILKTPFAVGRRPGLELTVQASQISQRHAEIRLRDGELALRDLGSTNGTFVNQRRLDGEIALKIGDVIHFARLEFQLGLFEEDQTEAILGTTVALSEELPALFVERTRMLSQMIREGAVTTLYQPIIDLSNDQVVAFEALGRGAFEGLPAALGGLFELAEIVGSESELTRAFRANTALSVSELPEGTGLFLNTHPNELRDGRLLGSLKKVRKAAGDRRMVLEIHEAAVTDPPSLLQLRRALSQLGIGIAYDDFGAGQARILELAEDPPDFLKFDIKLIQEIERSSKSRLKVTQSLVSLAAELGVATIAEGLETAGAVAVCRQIGFTHGQGYFLGEPAPVDTWS